MSEAQDAPRAPAEGDMALFPDITPKRSMRTYSHRKVRQLPTLRQNLPTKKRAERAERVFDDTNDGIEAGTEVNQPVTLGSQHMEETQSTEEYYEGYMPEEDGQDSIFEQDVEGLRPFVP